MISQEQKIPAQENGLLLIDKPSGITSFDVIRVLRKKLGIRKMGHSGTLDPLATGLMIIGLDKATKRLTGLTGLDKKYEVLIEFGKTSTTYDADGQLTEHPLKQVGRNEFENALKDFIGEIRQTAPAFSAKRINGKRAYDLARQGLDVVIKPNIVKIHGIEILEWNWPFVNLRVACGKGTYIRSLAHDIGEKLDCGGYVKSLRRIAIGDFKVEDAIKLDMNICRQCKNNFEVTPQDKTFYDKVSPVVDGEKYSVPEPAMCPPCREQLRLAWKNERQLYKRSCDLCGETTISIYSKDKPYKVYCRECWWSDKWDPMQYAVAYDFSRSFFDQFRELILKVPKQALHHNQNENCDFTTSTTLNRNCYLISSSGKNEDCYYGILLKGNKDSIDNTHIIESEACYECLDSKGGYNLQYCQNTYGCVDCVFLYDCRNSRNCFFSCGLRNRKYVFRNQQLSKEKYDREIASINLGSRRTVEELKQEFRAFCRDYPHLYYDGQNNEDVSCSNYIFNSKNCAFCFDAYDLEDCKFCAWYNESKDCYDVYAFGYGNELCYSGLEIGSNANRVLFSLHCWDSVNDLLYCLACHSSGYLFGCAGLKHKQYCILNKQYGKEEYEELVPRVIEHMVKNKEWGEFLPASFSHFGYNETMAQDFYPITKEEALGRGFKWHEQGDEALNVAKIIPAAKLPDNIREIPDDISNWAVKCLKTGRPYRILPQELKFYRMHNIPIPQYHPDERHRRRLQLRNPRQFFKRPCDKCGFSIITSYSPDKPEKVYCEKCYLKEVY